MLELVSKAKNIERYNCRFVKFDRTESDVLVALENRKKISAKILIGADGKKSFLRKLANIDFKFKNYHQKAFTFNVVHEKPHKSNPSTTF